MTTARDQFPEIAGLVDQIRATNGQSALVGAWVEDEEGYVLVGRRPPEEPGIYYMGADFWLEQVTSYQSRPTTPPKRGKR